jgi:hypothetical protein
LIEDEDAVVADDGVDAVGDTDELWEVKERSATDMGKRERKTHRLVLELAPNRFLNLRVRLEVNRSRRLIETDDPRVLDECASERNEAAFSDGHVRSLVVDLRIEGEATGLT